LEKGVNMIEVDIVHMSRAHGVSSMRALEGAIRRFLFVMYIGMRQWLLHWKILRVPPIDQ
jgi:hypothetical protein